MSTGLLTRSARRPAPAPPIDPRLRARRDEVARDRGRRRLRRLVLAVVVVAAVAAAGLAVRSSLLDVDRVVIRGATHTGHDQAIRSVGIPLGRSMISVDPAAAQARLLRLPWVARATVERQWPGTVAVSLVERHPVAVVGRGSHLMLVDREGRVLGPAHGAATYPSVTTATVRPGDQLGPARRSLLSVVAGLPGPLRRQVERARTSRTGVTLVLDDGVIVRWGDPSRTEAKAEALGALLVQAGRPTIATIDVSVPTAAALTRKNAGES